MSVVCIQLFTAHSAKHLVLHLYILCFHFATLYVSLMCTKQLIVAIGASYRFRFMERSLMTSVLYRSLFAEKWEGHSQSDPYFAGVYCVHVYVY